MDIIHNIIFLKEKEHWNLEDAKMLLDEHNIEYKDYEETDDVICFNRDAPNVKNAVSDNLRLLYLTPLVFLLLTDLGEDDDEKLTEQLQIDLEKCIVD
jgi:hypothetical protein